MDSYTWAQIITLGLAIAVLVILIVVLTRNNLTDSNNNIGSATTTATLASATQTSMIKEDNKVNWLYGLAIAEAGIVVVFGVLTLLAMIRWSRMGK
jgi:hypothetical protein